MDCSSVQCTVSSSLFIYSSLLYNLCKTKKLSGFGSTDCLHFNEEKMRERKKNEKKQQQQQPTHGKWSTTLLPMCWWFYFILQNSAITI